MKDLQKEIDILTFQIKKLCNEESLDVKQLDYLIDLSYKLRSKYEILYYIKDERNKCYR